MASTVGIGGRDYRYESEPPYSCSVWTAPTKPKASSATTASKFEPWLENHNTKKQSSTTSTTNRSSPLPFENSFASEGLNEEKQKTSLDGDSPSSTESGSRSKAAGIKRYTLWNNADYKNKDTAKNGGSYSSSRSSVKEKSTQGSPVGSLSSGASTSPKWNSPERKSKKKVDVTSPEYITDWISAACKDESMIPENLMSMISTNVGGRGTQGKKRYTYQQKVKWNLALKNSNGTLAELDRLYFRMQNGSGTAPYNAVKEDYEIQAVPLYCMIKHTLDMSTTLDKVMSQMLKSSGELRKFRGYINPRKIAMFQTLAGEALTNLAACHKFFYVMYPLVETLMEARELDADGTEELDTVIALVNHQDFLLAQVLRSVSNAFREYPQEDYWKRPSGPGHFSGYNAFNHGQGQSAYGYM